MPFKFGVCVNPVDAPDDFVLAFMTSFDDVIMPMFLGGIGAGTVPKVMMDSLYTISDPSVMAVSASISAVGLVLLVVTLTLRARGGV